MVKINSKAQQKFNQHKALEYIALCGWTKTIHIGICVWPTATRQTQQRMAQYTLRQLKEDGKVLWETAEDQSVVYALSERGARTLRQQTDAKVRSGKDAINYRKNFAHRILINEVAARLLGRGQLAWPEHAVRGWKSPIKCFNWQIALGLTDRRKRQLKYPDLIVKLSDDEPQEGDGSDGVQTVNVAWVEVEQGPKGGTDYAYMVCAMLSMVAPLTARGIPQGDMVRIETSHVHVCIAEVWLVCPSETHKIKFANRIARLAAQTPWKFSWQYAMDRVSVLTPSLEFESLGELLKRKGLLVTGQPVGLD